MTASPRMTRWIGWLQRVVPAGAALLFPAVSILAADASATNSVPAAKSESSATNSVETAQSDGSSTNSVATAQSDSDEITAESAKNYPNWVEFSTGGIVVDGDKASFQQRYRLQKGVFGGVEDFHWEEKVSKNNYLQVDGRAIFDNHDYNLKVELTNPKLGFLRGGYKEFRTWSDPAGGFLPQTGLWYAPNSEPWAVDRGEAWIEGGLTLPDLPKFTFKYTHTFRKGQEDSTSWGDVARPGGLGNVSIFPAFLDLDEKRDIFEGDVKHTIGKTDLGLGLRYELVSNNDSLNTQRRSDDPALNKYMTSRDNVQSDIFNAHAFTETRLSEKVRFTTGYSFTTLDNDLSGQRVYADAYDVGFRPLLNFFPNNEGFYALAGGSQMKEYVMNLNLMVTPWNRFSIIPSIRVQKEDMDSRSSLVYTGPGPGQSTPFFADSDQSILDVTERLEARYSGVTNWVFYARGDWTEGQGSLYQNTTAPAPTLGAPVLRLTDDNRFIQKYTVGANWYPLRRLNIDVQYYHKIYTTDYQNLLDSTDNSNASIYRYPAYLTGQDFDTDDANVRVTLRPFSNLTLVSRYDFQISSLYATPDPVSTLSKQPTADVTSHIVGQSITYVPWPRIYLQGGLNYVLDSTDSAGSAVTQAVQTGKNNYWDATFTSGYVINAKTDVQAHYFYYRADDFVDNSAFGVPYGAGGEEHGITVSLVRRLNDHLRLSLKYGFFNGTDAAAGGHRDYSAHLVYSSLQYRF